MSSDTDENGMAYFEDITSSTIKNIEIEYKNQISVLSLSRDNSISLL